jgi:hypothetical protein
MKKDHSCIAGNRTWLYRLPQSQKLCVCIDFIGVLVCYHCGGWSEEVNSCILISYMVYL